MKKLAYLILVALTVMVSACKKNEDEKVLSFEKTDVLFTYEEGEASLKAETSSDLTDVSSDADWCTPVAKKNMLAIKVTENVAKEPRSASVTVKNGDGLSQKLSIVQNGAKYIFDASDIEIPAAGGAVTVEYYAQDKGVIVVPENVTWLKAEATKDGFILTAEQNATLEARSAKISYAVSSKSGSFNVRQLGADPVLEVDAEDINASSEGGSYSFDYTANSTVVATCPADWVKVTVADGKINVDVEFNYVTEPRSTTVTYKLDKTSLSGTIAVNQEASPVLVQLFTVEAEDGTAVSDFAAPATGLTQKLNVKANVSWTASASESWVTVTPASYTAADVKPVTTAMTLKVAANTSTEPREATVTLTAPDKTEDGTIVLKITQTPEFAVDIKVLEVESDAVALGYTPNMKDVLYLTNIMEKSVWAQSTPKANAQAFMDYLVELGTEFDMTISEVIDILAYVGDDSEEFTELDAETEYVAFAFAVTEDGRIDSDISTAEFVTPKDPWVYLGQGMWQDNMVTEWFTNMSKNPWAVDVYGHSEKPGLYYVDTPYGPVGMGSLFGLDPEECEAYENGNWKHVKFRIDATDPTKVSIPLQEIGLLANSTYGWISVGSQYTSTSGSVVNISFGTLADGKITFPKNGMLKSMELYNNGGLYYANVDGSFYVTIPQAGTTAKAAPKSVRKSAPKFNVDCSRFAKTTKIVVPFKPSGERVK